MPELTKEQREKYVEGCGNECPVCGSDNISGGHIMTDSSGAWQVVECDECGARWHEIYRLIDVKLAD